MTQRRTFSLCARRPCERLPRISYKVAHRRLQAPMWQEDRTRRRLWVRSGGFGDCRKHIAYSDAAGGGLVGLRCCRFQVRAARKAGGEDTVEGVTRTGGVEDGVECGGRNAVTRRADATSRAKRREYYSPKKPMNVNLGNALGIRLETEEGAEEVQQERESRDEARLLQMLLARVGAGGDA